MISVTIFGVEFSLWALIAIGVGVAIAALVILICCVYWCCCHNRTRKEVVPSPRDAHYKAGYAGPGSGRSGGGSGRGIGSPRMMPQGAACRSYPIRGAYAQSSPGSEILPANFRPPPPPPLGPSPAKPLLGPNQLASELGSPGGSRDPTTVAKWEEDLRAAMFRKMSLEEVRSATGYFNKRNFIGEGAFAVVFRGRGPGGVPWAVKRSKRTLTDGSAGALDFENEVLMISRLSHRNLVRLLGYCTEGGEHILVYEFAEKGSLGSALVRNKPDLSFEARLDIAIGTAEALHYLHTAVVPPIVHRDIKPDNIFLDSGLGAKVGDFGLLKNLMDVAGMGAAQQESVYTRIAGTPGYLDPDYHLTSKITTKGDVYSFGVVLLELCTGQRAILHSDPNAPSESASAGDGGGTAPSSGSSLGRASAGRSSRGSSGRRSAAEEEERGPIHISQWVAPYVRAKVVEPIADPRFGSVYNHAALFRMMEVGVLCTTAAARKRPDMGAVVRWLNEVREQMRRSQMMEQEGGCEQEEEVEGQYSSVFELGEGLTGMEAGEVDSVRRTGSAAGRGGGAGLGDDTCVQGLLGGEGEGHAAVDIDIRKMEMEDSEERDGELGGSSSLLGSQWVQRAPSRTSSGKGRRRIEDV